jgi:2-iminobutanoate/2-iminopropanoate deaminase
MPQQVIRSEQLYPVYGPYSHAIRVGDMIFLHGTVGFDAQGQLPGVTPGRADMVLQCEQTIANMATALQLLGGSLQDVVKARAFLPRHCRPARAGQLSFDQTFDSIYAQRFQPPRPARAALQQSLFQEDLLVEIEAIAVVNQPKRLIVSEALPPLRRPYAQGGILVGNLLFLRGFTSQNQHGDLVGRGDMRAQTTQVFANMATTLREVGGSLADLVQTHVTLPDWQTVQDYEGIYAQHVQAPFPANTALQGGLGGEGLLIEIESIAALGTPRLTVDTAPQLPPPRAQAHGVRVGDLMFVSGQVSVDAHGRLVGPGDIRVQTQQVLRTIATILAQAGLGLEHVVKTTVMLTDWRHYEAYNDVYRSFFASPYPVRSTIGGTLGTPGALIEIEAIAMAGTPDSAIVATSL